MDRRERYSDDEELLRVSISGYQSKMWTALPGIVETFNAEAMTCSVQPSIMANVRKQNGDFDSIKLPLLVDCPVVFSGGGGCTLTFPIKPGDECLVVFASRCIDGWWQLGGVQAQAEFRMHDLSDGFVLPGVRSQPRKFDVSTTRAQLRTDDGAAFVELDPDSKLVKVNTSGNITATAGGSITANAANQATITAPAITLNGNVTINGTLSQIGGGAANFSGSLTAQGDVQGQGISLKNHVHGGVQPGGGTTAAPT